jgi:hypothetical protein
MRIINEPTAALHMAFRKELIVLKRETFSYLILVVELLMYLSSQLRIMSLKLRPLLETLTLAERTLITEW